MNFSPDVREGIKRLLLEEMKADSEEGMSRLEEYYHDLSESENGWPKLELLEEYIKCYDYKT